MVPARINRIQWPFVVKCAPGVESEGNRALQHTLRACSTKHETARMGCYSAMIIQALAAVLDDDR